MYWVYILRCADDTLYTGTTDNVDRRAATHNSGKGAKYTRGRGPVKVVYREECVDKSAALRRELAIKRLDRGEKLKLISSAAPLPWVNAELAESGVHPVPGGVGEHPLTKGAC